MRISEALLPAHITAKINADGFTLDLIADASRHMGQCLASTFRHVRGGDRMCSIGPLALANPDVS